MTQQWRWQIKCYTQWKIKNMNTQHFILMLDHIIKTTRDRNIKGYAMKLKAYAMHGEELPTIKA